MSMNNKCNIPGCNKPSVNKIKPGPCGMHKTRIKQHGCAFKTLRSSKEQPYSKLVKVAKTFSETKERVYYWIVFIDNKPQYVHRLIMEYYLGRKLHKNEVVHHVDGNGLNNRLSNLVVMFRAEHKELHEKETREVYA